MFIGYTRVSSRDQILNLQQDGQAAAKSHRYHCKNVPLS